MSESKKVRGVADIVFLIDVTGSMQPCIDALRDNIRTFIDTLSTSDANNSNPIKDWRGRVIGYRDHKHDAEWLVQFPFVRDTNELKGQLSKLQAQGGGDEPESLLDALYMVSTCPQGAKGEVDELKWRYLSDASRVVVLFTDATYHAKMTIPEAAGGDVDDVINHLTTSKILLTYFAPNLPCYDELAKLPKSAFECIDIEPGMAPHQALSAFTSKPESFTKTMEKLARSVSQSAFVPPAN
jgi:hypothetical protein